MATESSTDFCKVNLPNLEILENIKKFLEITQYYIDNFISLVQTDSRKRLMYFARGIFCRFNLIFSKGSAD